MQDMGKKGAGMEGRTTGRDEGRGKKEKRWRGKKRFTLGF
jgi:hypothetical protein